MSQIQGAGGQPQKQPKYASIYTGRVFNGLYTNRSPLRGSLPSMYEQFYKLSYGDVMIAGSNVEVSNRLTLIRRPGNSLFTSSTYSNVQAFFEFIVNKASEDAFGITLEEIFTMIATPGTLYAENNGVSQEVFTDPAATGQTYLQAIGNELYFSNGIDNKKWLQSLITWAPNFKLEGSLGTSGAYPFFSTYLLTGATSPTSNTQQIQQFVGVACAEITHVAVAGGVVTITISTSSVPTNASGVTFPVIPAVAVNPSFQLWGLSTATWLNGVIITATNATTITIGTTTTITANFTAPAGETTYPTTADTGWVQQIGFTSVVAETGTTVPNWGTNAVANTNVLWGAPVANGGNFLLDGNLLWVNRGSTVENWGIVAPDNAVTTSETNSTFTKWSAGTFYSVTGLIYNPVNSKWYWIKTPGTTGTTFGTGTAVFEELATQPSAWVGHTAYNDGEYAGSYPWAPGTVTIDNVVYQVGQFLPNNYAYDDTTVPYNEPALVVQTAGGVPCLFMAQRNTNQTSGSPSTAVPLSTTYGGSLSGQTGRWIGAAVENEGWAAALFNRCGFTNTGGMINLKYGGGPGLPLDYTAGTPVSPNACTSGLTSLLWNFTANNSPMNLQTVNPAGEITGSTVPFPTMPGDQYEFLQWGKVRIPEGGMNVTFTITAADACYFGADPASGATFVSGTSTVYQAEPGSVAPTSPSFGGQTQTPWMGYTILGGWNGPNNAQTMTITVNFPTAGVWGMEWCFGKNNNYGTGDFFQQIMTVSANASTNGGGLIVPESAATQPWFESTATLPVFQGFSTAPAANNTYPITIENSANTVTGRFGYPSTGNQGTTLEWLNLGPVSAFTWASGTSWNVTAGEVSIIADGDEFFPYEPGLSGVTEPTFNGGLYSITPDIPPLQWINEGTIPPITPATGAILATSTQGWLYWIALVNTLDNTVSNLSPVSIGTGPVNGNVTIPAGSGLILADIDPQADYVAIFRSTDGGSIPLLNPGLGNTYWTLPLTTYLQDGFVDSTSDADLDELITGAQAGENTPPLPGVGTLTYHLGRIFYSIGNTLFYTTGASSVAGNGTGANPSNYDTLPSQIIRLVPTAIGLLVFTLSGTYIVAGNGTANSPLLPAVPYLTGIGLANYNALDINGSLIGFFTTDKQFLIMDPSSGVSYAGYPIGDQFRQNTGQPGTSWNTKTVYVAWYTFGEDQGWFVGDGQFGWYKLINTPSPESGMCWSPFATIQGGAGAIASVQTSPGVHSLLIASPTGVIMERNLNATTDVVSLSNGSVPYPAYAVFGSYILAVPGQVAKVGFITTDSVNVGSPMIIGLLIDEALPYFKGSFDILKNWTYDPPCLKPSKSILSQRFYLAENEEDAAYCRHLQLMCQWPAEAAQNELQSFTLWGAYEIEQ